MSPFQSEGLPIVALEAMEYGKPMLLTDGWKLPVTSPERFCWRVPCNPASFEAGLTKMMTTPDALLAQMGQEARIVVRESFGWDSAAEQAIKLYLSFD